VKNGEEHDERVMAIASIALRQPPADRERYLRLACENDDLYRETADVVEQEEELRDFMKPPILKVERRCPFQAGQLLESQRFEIVREIGEGGMACVYEALDRKRNQRIAIKGAKTGFHRLLPSELNGALEVRHWNVCLVNEIHTAQAPDGEIDFLTMELLKGETLSAKVAASGPVPKAEAFDLACQLCSGLAAIHTKVLHRDLKSSNIILCPAPTGIRAVVTDFGLACGIGETGEWGGTPRYMAPEVWRGEPSSKASDIYALGVVLYEMVTGKPPFENPVDCLERTPRAPSTLVPELGPKWDRVILPCLKPDPGDRPADAALVLAELKRRPARKLPWAIAALVLAGALSVPQFRHWLVDIIWPPPSVRLAVLPPDAASDDFALSKDLDIANWRLAERTAVFATELADALVTYLVCRTRRVKPVHEHPLSCGLQSKLLLVLERAHCCQRAELMVKRRHSHPCNRRKFLHVQRLGKVGAEPRNRSCGSVAEIACRRYGAESFSLRRAEDTVDNLSLDQGAE
jgi:hypothetical protein